MREKACASSKPINTECWDCSLSESECAACCVLSRRLNFHQLNVLGNVWKLNWDWEQRQVFRKIKMWSSEVLLEEADVPHWLGCECIPYCDAWVARHCSNVCSIIIMEVHILLKDLDNSHSLFIKMTGRDRLLYMFRCICLASGG